MDIHTHALAISMGIQIYRYTTNTDGLNSLENCMSKRFKRITTTSEKYRFLKVDGEMTKANISSANFAFEAAMKVHSGKKKSLEKELLIHGITCQD